MNDKREEREERLLQMLDGISDEYLADALSLHERLADKPRQRVSFTRRIAPIAAALIIAVAIVPLSFIISFSVGDGCSSANGNAPNSGDMEDAGDSMGSDIIYSQLTAGETVNTDYGCLTYVSYESGRVTLHGTVFEEELPYCLWETRSNRYFATNHPYKDKEDRVPVHDAVTVTYGEADEDGGRDIVIDFSAFMTYTGTDDSMLRLWLYGFGEIELAP